MCRERNFRRDFLQDFRDRFGSHNKISQERFLFQGDERVYQIIGHKIETRLETRKRLHWNILGSSVVFEEKRQRTSRIFYGSRAIVCEKIFCVKSFKILKEF
jgi:hypothetical protein